MQTNASSPRHLDGNLRAALRHPLTRRGFLGLLAVAGLGACVGGQSKGGLSAFRDRTVESPRPAFDPATYRLVVDGLVRSPLTLTYDELLSLPSTSHTCDFRCVEGWGVDDVPWEGVQMQTIISMAQPLDEARYVTFRSLGDTYYESLPLEQAELPIVLLAYRMYGRPLAPEHGSPLRVVFPRMFGYKGAKWLNRIEFRDELDSGYWEQFGYPDDAWVQDEQPCST